MTVNLNTSTMTRAQGREQLDRLRNAMRIWSYASLDRGITIDGSAIEYADAKDADERARAVAFAQLDIIGDLLLGLIEERGISATALRVLEEERAS